MQKLTIGQVAAFAGITIKTVRHYHRLGLIKEPKRDSSGYRRYDSSDLLRLVQVRTLAGAGVPLAEIRDLLAADPERFAAAVSDIQRRLGERIDELQARSRALDRLAHGDRLLLPDRACVYLDRLDENGFAPGYVAMLREGIVLFRAVFPEGFDDFLSQLEHRLDDPKFTEAWKRGWEVFSWRPDDPRIEELASALCECFLANPALLAMPTDFLSRTDAAARYGVVNHHSEEQSASLARLTELLDIKLRAAGINLPRQ